MSGSIAISSTPARPGASSPTPASVTPPPSPADAAVAATPTKRPLLNPRLHLDLALNLVVLQFFDDQGEVTSSIPSAKQLKAYTAQQGEPPAAPKAPAGDQGRKL